MNATATTEKMDPAIRRKIIGEMQVLGECGFTAPDIFSEMARSYPSEITPKSYPAAMGWALKATEPVKAQPPDKERLELVKKQIDRIEFLTEQLLNERAAIRAKLLDEKKRLESKVPVPSARRIQGYFDSICETADAKVEGGPRGE